MIVEYIRYSIPTSDSRQFELTYADAATLLDRSEHCLGYELAACVEDPTQYVLRIEWDSAEGHLRGFRRSPDFAPFVAKVRPYIRYILEMRHYTATGVSRTSR